MKCVMRWLMADSTDLRISVADGIPVDWPALDSEARDDDARDLLEQLKLVSDIAGAHRLMEDPASSAPTREGNVGVCDPSPSFVAGAGYDLMHELGRGTFGRVYRAWDPDLERFIASSCIRPIEGVKDAVERSRPP